MSQLPHFPKLHFLWKSSGHWCPLGHRHPTTRTIPITKNIGTPTMCKKTTTTKNNIFKLPNVVQLTLHIIKIWPSRYFRILYVIRFLAEALYARLRQYRSKQLFQFSLSPAPVSRQSSRITSSVSMQLRILGHHYITKFNEAYHRHTDSISESIDINSEWNNTESPQLKILQHALGDFSSSSVRGRRRSFSFHRGPFCNNSFQWGWVHKHFETYGQLWPIGKRAEY